MARAFAIPDDFRAFMREVAGKVDWGERADLVGAETLQHECGRGSLLPNSETFRFTYVPPGHGVQWEIELSEQQIRDIASGVLDEIDAVELTDGARLQRGEPLLVWGEYDEDALRARTTADLAIALDAMHSLSATTPCMVRLWSTSDEQAVAVVAGPDCALYIVASAAGYGRSVGDPTRSDTIELVDHDVGPLQIPCADCVPWRVARGALLRFAEHGDLGDEVIVDGSLPTQLLMLGDYDRDAELATRRDPPTDPIQSSVPRKAPQGEWATRLVRSLLDLQLIEVDMHIVDAVTARIAMLLLRSGDDAIDSPEAAHELARELARVRGVGALFATGGDLQIALRRTQEPPTQPVDITLL